MAMLPALFDDPLFEDTFDDWFDDPLFARMRRAALGLNPGDKNADDKDNNRHHGHGFGLVPANFASSNLMRTDVRENKDSYDVSIDMPGFKKDDISIELNDGYLTVSAHKDETHQEESKDGNNADSTDKDSNDKAQDGKWIRRERYVGTCSRSFYVGDKVTDSDIHAQYTDGTLNLQIAKVEPEPQVEQKHTIAIEG